MKEKVTAFYESKYFIPAMALVLFIIVTAVIYFVLEELKLWFALFILLCFIIWQIARNNLNEFSDAD
ncbi:hypothetical protein [Lactobacillus acetotolerans]|uniref:hypothetical protein n=1 Tax=Lactobacillus acetotolerans TaxID=1600 RepID=UPI0012E953C8|nr:hypothetical protein [Lactobacillus acetotolerans]QGV04237.1 hypothetical protein GJR85_01920 [Lactobacillus acetotolerans]